MSLILGLDMGITSIGWCLVDTASNHFHAATVRIFPPGVNIKPLGTEESWNVKRRTARLVRRQIARKRKRNTLLLEFLQHVGWLPKDEKELADIWRSDPYELRSRGLDELLMPYEWGRVLYHLNQRRGFKSNRKSQGSDDGKIFKGDSKIGKIGILALQQEMTDGGFRTLGEYLATLDTTDTRRRNRYTLRAMYYEEFDALWEAQVHFSNGLYEEVDFQDFVLEFTKMKYHQKLIEGGVGAFLRDYVIFYQRPLKSQKHLVGKCSFEPKLTRGVQSALVAQEFRIWDKLCNLRITTMGNRNCDPLTLQEKQKAANWLHERESAKIEDLKKVLGFGSEDMFNMKDNETIKGNKTATAIGKVFGKKQVLDWLNNDFDRLERIWKVCYDAKDNDWLMNYGIEKWDLDEKAVQTLSKLTFEQGYASISHKAMRRILEKMKSDNLDQAAAREAVGYHYATKADFGRETLLPDPPKLRNPIVQAGLFQLKKVVNEIIQEYGLKPDQIRIEFARELKQPKTVRESRLKNIRANETENTRIWNVLKTWPEFYNTDPTSADIAKYKLWEECNHECVYTGKAIGARQLFNGAFEIEHIYPRSRSLDDSFANKTLGETAFNKLKGNRTPYEMFAAGIISSETYDDILLRARQLGRTTQKGFNRHKFERFTTRKLELGFQNSNLIDTAYLAREAQSYLRGICPNVTATNGKITSELRRLWGLNSILNTNGLNVKTRHDHRHHAIDAAVVACTSPAMVQALARWHEKGDGKNQQMTDNEASRLKLTLPWDGFRNNLKDKVNEVLVSFRQRNRIRGGLHAETMYGAVLTPDSHHAKDKKGQPKFSGRVDLTGLKPAQVNKIADPVVKSLVIERILTYNPAFDKHLDGKNEKIQPETFSTPLYMATKDPTVKIPIKKVRVHDVSNGMIELRPGVWVEPGSNHHMVIWRLPNGKQSGEVVSLFEATQHKKRGESVIQTQFHDERTFVCSLATNELFLLDSDDFKTADIQWNNLNYETLSEHLYRVQIITDDQVTFRHHLAANLFDENDNQLGRKFAKYNTFKGVKVRVSAAGTITKALGCPTSGAFGTLPTLDTKIKIY